MTEAQILLQIHLKELGIESVAEYRFDAERQWRFDLCSLEHRIGFELDGGMFHGGHRRGVALEDDYEKQNTAQMQGWRVLRFTNRQALIGEAKEFVRRYFDDTWKGSRKPSQGSKADSAIEKGTVR